METQQSRDLRAKSPKISDETNTTRQRDSMPAYEARYAAQRLAFAPVVFQIARILRDRGILAALESNAKLGLRHEDIAKHVSLPTYSLKLLLDGGATAGILLQDGDRYFISKMGHFLLNDTLTRVNFDFVNDVCYQGMFHLEESLMEERPAGLKVFGEWSVIYEGLSQLPEKTKQSWFAFDHFYSDSAFNNALPYVFKHNPAKILDVGGNTGRFAEKCLGYDSEVNVTIFDLPGQIAMARKHFETHPNGSRMDYFTGNVLDEYAMFPNGADVIWMSQFLDCFSADEIRLILRKAAKAMHPASELFILETYCDRQKYDASRYCVVNTSFYFTCMANGNSRMYNAVDMIDFLSDAGFKITEDRDDIGFSHTLFRCVPK